MTGVSYAAYYKLSSSHNYCKQAEFSIGIPDMNALTRVFEMRRNKGMEESTRKVNTQMNKVIYIPICKEDLITVETLDNTDVPYVIDNDVE
mmetsp:Transcript_35291/g.40757  ORF Transcript_35291/g.40757 Transcript_35291/m.40757 type:complete len:91 (+) Transcript_35291:568-840(+)|eukprot:CAMPEP_0168320758 /NCGR_PEP_ID=MMETSP0213-20121227/1868_1 /TAXON_ID=151035 /ORGANISM="Euplotes harpa, Strain FSP1.4" /LENGTH=90 /DNA_ID=CAMNT_0008322283 /DNA_START=531 /DNA_END=803 /DNA_ORIENTATION=+